MLILHLRRLKAVLPAQMLRKNALPFYQSVLGEGQHTHLRVARKFILIFVRF